MPAPDAKTRAAWESVLLAWWVRVARSIGRTWRWTFAGVIDPAHRALSTRTLVAGALIGGLAGWWSGGAVVIVREMPRPVTPPPPGMAWVHVKTTGYDPGPISCGPFANGITSTGVDTRVQPYGIAVDPKLLPYKTALEVPGYGYAASDDTGSAMRHDGSHGVLHIDLRFKTYREALRWGVRWVWMAVPAATAVQLPSASDDAPH